MPSWAGPDDTPPPDPESEPEEFPPPGEAHLSPLDRARRDVSVAGPEEAAHVADDTAVSDDDEDVEELGEVGVPVVERLLGATIIKDETS
jgi:DNA polymerase-3 subunit gamma/tau